MGYKKNITYLILGLGIGIIITNILHSAYPKLEVVELDDNTIIERARGLGMVPIKESIKIEKEELKEELSEETGVEEWKEEYIEDKIFEEEKEIIIESGSNLTTVAEQLYNMNLIDDKDEFSKFVHSQNLSRKIITGRYKIKENSSYSKIIHILTHKNKGNN